MNVNQYVQYGCGGSAVERWRNFDASPTLRFERIPIIGRLYTRNNYRFSDLVEYGDIVKGLPIPSDSCAGVYCSHVLEHLALEDFRLALTNTRKLLKPGASFRLVVPDLEIMVKDYIVNRNDDAAIEFIKESYLGLVTRERGLKGFLVVWLGNSRHLWMWDFKSLRQELQNAGFESIRRASYGDSEDQQFNLVEDEGRWERCLGVECKRPLHL